MSLGGRKASVRSKQGDEVDIGSRAWSPSLTGLMVERREHVESPFAEYQYMYGSDLDYREERDYDYYGHEDLEGEYYYGEDRLTNTPAPERQGYELYAFEDQSLSPQNRGRGMESSGSGAIDKFRRFLTARKVGTQASGVKWKSRPQPWFIYLVTVIDIVVLLAEFIIQKRDTGSFISTEPFNIMIGPSAAVLINAGARFVPCIRDMATNTTIQMYPCPRTPNGSADANNCTLADLCGFDAQPSSSGSWVPNQWYRFILPVFMHVGLIHFLLNMIVQVTNAVQTEMIIGWWRMALVYMLSGVGGYIFGANFAPVQQPSAGASGALFGVLGCELVELLVGWRLYIRPMRSLLNLLLAVVLGVAVGLFLPGIDNFAHIGGFVAGVLASTLLLLPPSPKAVATSDFGSRNGWLQLSVLWRWAIALVAGTLLVFLFVLGLTNFYDRDDPSSTCAWCRHLACLSVGSWCNVITGNSGSQ